MGIRKLNSAKKKYKDNELDLVPKDSYQSLNNLEVCYITENNEYDLEMVKYEALKYHEQHQNLVFIKVFGVVENIRLK